MPSLFESRRPATDTTSNNSSTPTATDDVTASSAAGPATPARNGSPANCRSCTDFKTWANLQRGDSSSMPMGARKSSTAASATPTQPTSGSTTSDGVQQQSADSRGCPYDKDELGTSTWGLLHTMAAHYPDRPSVTEAKDMSTFFTVLAKFYPCEVCAKDFQQEIKVEPINATSQSALSQWLCRLHNKVNVKLGKPVFDCSNVNQRWRDGWADGSCD